jgi:hydroxymethylbilane synthase
MADLRLATRGSSLAMAQTRWVADALTAHHPGLEIETVVVTTSGDIDRSTPVTHLTELGAFVRAVQDAVLDGRADAAVHSCKDLPVAGPDGVDAVYPVRESPWDVLCGASLTDLPAGARVGTGSPRRSAQLALLRPDLRIDDIRGNVDTRLGKVAAGGYDAVVLADAGLRRLGRPDASHHRFPLDEMVPAPAQGALAVEFATGNDERRTRAADLLAVLDDPTTRRAVTAERSVLALTHLGCRGALGAYAEPGPGDLIRLTGFVDDGTGPRRATVEGRDEEVAAALCVELSLTVSTKATRA